MPSICLGQVLTIICCKRLLTHSELRKIWLLLQNTLQAMLCCPAEGCASLLSMLSEGVKVLVCFPLQVLQTLTDCSKRCRPRRLILHYRSGLSSGPWSNFNFSDCQSLLVVCEPTQEWGGLLGRSLVYFRDREKRRSDTVHTSLRLQRTSVLGACKLGLPAFRDKVSFVCAQMLPGSGCLTFTGAVASLG